MIRDLLDTIPHNGWTFVAAIGFAFLLGALIGCALPGRRT